MGPVHQVHACLHSKLGIVNKVLSHTKHTLSVSFHKIGGWLISLLLINWFTSHILLTHCHTILYNTYNSMKPSLSFFLWHSSSKISLATKWCALPLMDSKETVWRNLWRQARTPAHWTTSVQEWSTTSVLSLSKMIWRALLYIRPLHQVSGRWTPGGFVGMVIWHSNYSKHSGSLAWFSWSCFQEYLCEAG